MKTHSLETRLSKSTNSIGVAFFAIIGTGVLFSAMSLSRLGSVEPPEDVATSTATTTGGRDRIGYVASADSG
jgi:hypothetical protein